MNHRKQNPEDPKSRSSSVDLSFQEVVDHIGWILDPDTEEDLRIDYLNLVDSTFPGGDVSDIIFHPDSWFNDEKMRHADLTEEELTLYLMAWTGKRLVGAEVMDLPSIPESKSGDPPAVIAL